MQLLVRFEKSYSLILITEFSENEVDLKEKICSIPLHCSNHHKFRNNTEHKKCAHSPIKTNDRSKPWLKEGSKVRLVYRANNVILVIMY